MHDVLSMDATIDNPGGGASVLLVCDHASNFIPPAYDALGLPAALLEDHVAWDIGALGLARQLARALDAPLVSAPASRLLVDPNRACDAPDLIPGHAEGTPIPGNQRIDAAERARRLAAFHAPFHAAIDELLAARPDITALVSVHSFTPVLLGAARPWQIGVLHDDDTRLADPLIAALGKQGGLTVGRNQPYAPTDGVYYTLQRHAKGRATVMIEVRNDALRDEQGQHHWSAILAGALAQGLSAIAGTNDTTSQKEDVT